ncbi:hypothetical protein N7541_000398 [Penicillium brevicompactum]|uniref:Aminoglycoside phosphotransferase domain-containing protein n=1 Tax=Penicillium brevicompactum TaxID=5074 RepID=A0A9W9RU14_PENBR|nr:hypothetical protein N7541_000398 [Penicillium brevicompactum]
MKFGQPLQPLQRLHREIYNYQTQSPFEHIASLKKYLHIATYLIPQNNSTITRPVMRHPDLQPNNIFVSDKLEITGLIDWQHSVVLPLPQCGIPRSLQNYSNEVSESLQIPRFPDNINDLEEREQFEQVELLRRRQLHHSYVNFTAKSNSEHYDALEYDMRTLRRKLFHHASAPWEGDNVSLKADLIALSRGWSKMDPRRKPQCPISFSEEESSECLQLQSAQTEADEQMQACQEAIGVGHEGWVPAELYDGARQRERNLMADALDAVESDEEKTRIKENWIFGDFCEEDYL